MRVADAEVPARLEPLGFSVSDDPMPIDRHRAIGPSVIAGLVTVPSFRVDVLREVDLIEEIARHDGYEGLPATFPELDRAAAAARRARRCAIGCLRQVLTACGFSEAMTFAFIEAEPRSRSPPRRPTAGSRRRGRGQRG